MSWNSFSRDPPIPDRRSASSWGCELKYSGPAILPLALFVSLFVRLWVEIPTDLQWPRELLCQPLREAVSWNGLLKSLEMSRKVSLFVRLWVEIHRSCRNSNPGSCQPLREAVSWNMTGDYMVAVQEGQPLREAVSWNSLCQRNLTEKVGSASSWGCELKYYSLIITGKCFTVSLFVRLWVEMYDRGWNDALEKSASSWGCELK